MSVTKNRLTAESHRLFGAGEGWNVETSETDAEGVTRKVVLEIPRPAEERAAIMDASHRLFGAGEGWNNQIVTLNTETVESHRLFGAGEGWNRSALSSPTPPGAVAPALRGWWGLKQLTPISVRCLRPSRTGSSGPVRVETARPVGVVGSREVAPALRGRWGLKHHVGAFPDLEDQVAPALRGRWGLKRAWIIKDERAGQVAPALRGRWGLKQRRLSRALRPA